MDSQPGAGTIVRFAGFELNLQTGELREDGVAIRLQPQPTLILTLLVSRPGSLVTREEIQQRVWGTETFIDFDTGLNSAIRQIRHALKDNTGAPCFVETVPRRGYRFLAPLEKVEQSGGPAAQPFVAPDRSDTVPATKPRTWWRSKWILAGGGVALAALLVVAIWFAVFRAQSEAIDSVAVLPFDNASTDSDTEYLSDGFTETLIGQLSQIPRLKVMARSTVFRYKGSHIDPQKVGRDLKVRAVLTGRVLQRGETLTISMELIDVRDGSQLWGRQYSRKLADTLAVQEDIAHEVTGKLRLRLAGVEEKRLTAHVTENAEAYQLYLKGRYYWNKRTPDGIHKAVDSFQQAIEKDPGYALAYAGLADCYQVPANPLPPREKMPLAKAAAMKALQLDDTLVEAHTTLARVFYAYDWDWPGAEKEFKRAIELNPRYAPVHQWYGGYLSATGRFPEADAEKKRALDLEPVSLVINFEVGLASYTSRNYDRAIVQFQKTLELDPNFPPPHTFLAAAYEQKGMFEEAIATFQRAISVTQGPPKTLAMASLGHVYAVSGRKAEAHKILAELQRLSERSYVAATDIALVYSGLGEKDKSFAWLDKAYEEHSFSLSQIKVEPRFDALRSDPRFADLLRRIGLPQ
ncbi:MAG TPA: tetratricopeptide repeat protein [Candidatus Polarisedimenticolia bacterium]|nr:tetratricopeptide repeat protein [Candidatus Polarisedimenticolia bacterium]